MQEYKAHLLTAILAISFFIIIWQFPLFFSDIWQILSKQFFNQLGTI